MDWIEKAIQFGAPPVLIANIIVLGKILAGKNETKLLTKEIKPQIVELRRDVDRIDGDVTVLDSRLGITEVKLGQVEEMLNRIAQGQADMRKNQNEWNEEIRNQLKDLRDQQGRFYEMFSGWSVEMMERFEAFSKTATKLNERTAHLSKAIGNISSEVKK